MLHYLNEVLFEMGLGEFKVTPDNREALNQIHRYLMKPSKRGLLLNGSVGNGKSVMMEAFRRCMRYIYRIGLMEFNAPYIRNNYYQESTGDHYTLSQKLHFYRYLVINDLGFERPYGSGEDIIQTILFDRFEGGLVTHGTTNLIRGEFIARYNDDKNRMADRFKIMFEFVEVKGESYR
jgi:DNA replication protein DnaC